MTYRAIPRPKQGVRGSDHCVLGKSALRKIFMEKKNYLFLDAYRHPHSLGLHRLTYILACFCTVSICTVLAQLMLPASAAVEYLFKYSQTTLSGE
jgi:hypothetical protein